MRRVCISESPSSSDVMPAPRERPQVTSPGETYTTGYETVSARTSQRGERDNRLRAFRGEPSSSDVMPATRERQQVTIPSRKTGYEPFEDNILRTLRESTCYEPFDGNILRALQWEPRERQQVTSPSRGPPAVSAFGFRISDFGLRVEG